MALVKMGSIVTQLSGRVGGQTFGRSKGGNYVKNTGSYPRSSSAARQNKLALFGTTAQAWRSLSAVGKADWNGAAPSFPYVNRLGETKEYSGFNLFVKFNGNLREIGGSIVTAAPSPESFDPNDETEFNWSSPILSITSQDVDDLCLYIVYCTRRVSFGRSSSGLNFKKIAVVSAAQIEGTYDLSSEYRAAFGTLSNTGEIIYCRLKAVKATNGQAMDNYFEGSARLV